MVVVKINSGKEFYMDNFLESQFEKERAIVNEKDEDRVWIIDGKERVGKSVFAMQCAAKVDPFFVQSQVVYSANSFTGPVNPHWGQLISFSLLKVIIK